MSNLIFNLRIWAIHLQFYKNFNIKVMFAWYDFWVGLFVDKKKCTWYLFLIPMIGIKIEGINIGFNRSYDFKRDPFIRLFPIR